MRPPYSIGDHTHGSNATSERIGDCLDRLSTRSPLEYLKNLHIGQFMAAMRCSFLRDFSKNIVGVLNVLGECHVFKVRDMIVGRVPVFVIDGEAVRRPDEGQSHEPVDGISGRHSILAKAYSPVVALESFLAQKFGNGACFVSANFSRIANFVDSYVTINWLPSMHVQQFTSLHHAIKGNS